MNARQRKLEAVAGRVPTLVTVVGTRGVMAPSADPAEALAKARALAPVVRELGIPITWGPGYTWFEVLDYAP